MQNAIGSNNFAQHVNKINQLNSNNEIPDSINTSKRKNNTPQTEYSNVTVQQQLNITILKYDINISYSSDNKSLNLLFKTAIEGINDVIGDGAIEDVAVSGLDMSPEATAERIVSMSTAFFSSYQEQHPEMTEPEAAESFASLIKGGIDKGFSEARGILSSLKVLEGSVANNIDETYSLVQEGLQDFLERHTKSSNNDDEELDGEGLKYL